MTLNASPIGTPVTTPQIINPDVPSSQISFVPIAGTGLSGEVYAPGDWIGKLEHLEEIIETNTPDATFTATQIAYGGNRSDTTIAEFLGDDAASLIGDGELEMGPSGLRLTGYIYIPAGEHEVSVYSDDGFALALGGVEFSELRGVAAPTRQPAPRTSRAASMRSRSSTSTPAAVRASGFRSTDCPSCRARSTAHRPIS